MRPLVALALSLASLPALAQDAPAEPTEAAAAEVAPVPPTTTYRLQPSGSDVYVVIRNDTDATLARLGHDHVIYASDFEGTVTWPNTPDASCSIDIRVPVNQLTVDPGSTRDKAGLDDNTIDDGDKAKLKKNMWSKSQLRATDYPAVVFNSTSCDGTGGKVTVSGTLTVRGVSQPVSLTMDVSADGSAFSAKGSFDTSHTAFGFKPFAATALGPRNQDRLSFVVQVVGAK